VIQGLPKNLSVLDQEQLRDARDRRDARMSTLFRLWPTLSKVEMRELRRLSDERQRLARHVGILRGLHRLRTPRDPADAEAISPAISASHVLPRHSRRAQPV
jgi:hypothetical protein